MVEIDNELYAAVQALGKDVVVELARGLVRARMLHPVFAEGPIGGARVVYEEACELVASANERESVARQRAEAVDTAVTAIRYMGKFGVTSPVGASEGVKVAYDSDDDFEGVREAPATLDEENTHLRIAQEIEDLRAKERNLETMAKAFRMASAREARMREALELLYGKLLMSERDGEVVITAEDGEIARAALRKGAGDDVD